MVLESVMDLYAARNAHVAKGLLLFRHQTDISISCRMRSHPVLRIDDYKSRSVTKSQQAWCKLINCPDFIHKLDASCFNKLQQETWWNLMKPANLMQLDDENPQLVSRLWHFWLCSCCRYFSYTQTWGSCMDRVIVPVFTELTAVPSTYTFKNMY